MSILHTSGMIKTLVVIEEAGWCSLQHPDFPAKIVLCRLSQNCRSLDLSFEA